MSEHEDYSEEEYQHLENLIHDEMTDAIRLKEKDETIDLFYDRKLKRRLVDKGLL